MNSENKITGYAVYNKEVKKRKKTNTLETLFAELPNKKYDVIYADPPWDYNGKLQFDKSSTSKEKIDFSRNIFVSSADFKYPTVKTEELKTLPVVNIANDNCLLFMWSTNPHLSQAIALGQAWGFEYRTVVFIWNKMIHNPGKYTLSNCEMCLLFKRGKIPTPRGVRNIQQLVSIPRGKHSEKPHQIRKNIELMFPTQQKIELFARHESEGWDIWGLDAHKMEIFFKENNE